MKKVPIAKLKSHIPIVKRASYTNEKIRADTLQYHLDHLKADLAVTQKVLDETQHEAKRTKEYNKWFMMHYPTPQLIAQQRLASTEFNKQPRISVILPVYNTNPDYLTACIDSVIAQSYVNWELCIVDDASSSHTTLDVLKKYKKSADPRIKITHSKKNGHISVASNLAIEKASGEFVALLDHDDVLWPNALFEVVKLLQDHPDADFIYSDEDKIEADGYVHFNPYFKPDWSPHLLECINYITHFSVLRTALVKKVGRFDSHMVGTQDWDLFLRISEQTNQIFHVPTILYSWRAHEGSTASSVATKSYVFVNQENALKAHFERSKPNYAVNIERANYNFWYARYEVADKPLVSIVIPTKDKVDYLKRCITSIVEKTNYRRYEIIIVDTGSKEPETAEYYSALTDSYGEKKLRIKTFLKKPFNYSSACNYGAKQAKGDYLIMLNNDTQVLTDSWIEDMLGYAQQPDIAAVGAKLLFPSGKIQHAGVTTGIGSWEPVAAHIGTEMENASVDPLQITYTHTVRDVSGVTAACLMVATDIYWKVGGFDPIYRVTFNDVDLNLKFRELGYHNIYLPFVELLHDESVSVGRVTENRDMTELHQSALLMRARWPGIIDSDPYYNKNFFILSSHFDLDIYPSQEKPRY